MSNSNDWLGNIERNLNLLNAILDLSPDIHQRCQGDPSECGEKCESNSCPLQNNRLQDLGGLVMTLLDEFTWHRAWAEELEILQMVPPGSLERVALRVKRGHLQDLLQNTIKAHTSLQEVPVLHGKITKRIDEIQVELQALDEEIKSLGGSFPQETPDEGSVLDLFGDS